MHVLIDKDQTIYYVELTDDELNIEKTFSKPVQIGEVFWLFLLKDLITMFGSVDIAKLSDNSNIVLMDDNLTYRLNVARGLVEQVPYKTA